MAFTVSEDHFEWLSQTSKIVATASLVFKIPDLPKSRSLFTIVNFRLRLSIQILNWRSWAWHLSQSMDHALIVAFMLWTGHSLFRSWVSILGPENSDRNSMPKCFQPRLAFTLDRGQILAQLTIVTNSRSWFVFTSPSPEPTVMIKCQLSIVTHF